MVDGGIPPGDGSTVCGPCARAGIAAEGDANPVRGLHDVADPMVPGRSFCPADGLLEKTARGNARAFGTAHGQTTVGPDAAPRRHGDWNDSSRVLGKNEVVQPARRLACLYDTPGGVPGAAPEVYGTD